MILSCNSCEKKFVVPDNAIGVNGRIVQCSSCGNKWKQFPQNKEVKPKEVNINIKSINKKPKNEKKISKRKFKKKIGPSLYSPEYLAKKHGIRINKTLDSKNISIKNKINVNFGFYNSLIVFFIITLTVVRLLYFSQDIIVNRFPFFEVYLEYLFENIINIKMMIQNFLLNY